MMPNADMDGHAAAKLIEKVENYRLRRDRLPNPPGSASGFGLQEGKGNGTGSRKRPSMGREAAMRSHDYAGCQLTKLAPYATTM